MKLKESIIDYIHSFFFNECPVLSKRQIQVVKDRVLNKLTYAEIAKSLGRSNTQAKNIFERSINILNLFKNEVNPDTLINDTLLSKRIKNALERMGNIKSIKDLSNFPYHKLANRYQLGIKSIEEIQKYISVLGYSLTYNIEDK